MFYIFFSCYILQLIKSAIQHWRFYYLSSQIQWNYFIVGNIWFWSFNLFKLLEFRSSNWNTKEMSIKWTWSDANFRPYQPKNSELNKYLNQFSSNFRALYIFKSDLVTREIVKNNFNKPCKRLKVPKKNLAFGPKNPLFGLFKICSQELFYWKCIQNK